MVPAGIISGLVVIMAAPDLALRNLGVGHRRLGLARLLVDLVHRFLSGSADSGRGLRASAAVGLGQFDAVGRFVDRGRGGVELPRLDVVGGIGIVIVVIGILVGFEFADEDGRVGEAADLGRGVVHAAEVLSKEEGSARRNGRQGYNAYVRIKLQINCELVSEINKYNATNR